MTKPADTTKIPQELLLLDAMTQGSSESIESSERRGGEEMLNSTVVPTDGSDQLVDLGFQLGEVVEDDPIFRNVIAPEGWTRKMGENRYGYWTYLVDPEGNERVAMFYKAAFYDRSAHLHVVNKDA